jgi:hypothetical protein
MVRDIPQRNPTEANNLGSMATENGTGSKGEMGEAWERIEASSGDGETGLGSQALDVGIRP